MAWRARHSRRLEDVEIDALGEPIALPTRSGGVRLHLPPGRCALRTLNVGGMSGKEIRPALMLCAEGSLLHPPEHYVIDSWRIDADRFALAALPREPLERARRRLQAAGSTVAAVSAAELRPPRDPRPSLVLWSLEHGDLLACLWRERVLHHWQSFPPGTPGRAVAEQLAAAAAPIPETVYVDGPRTDLDPPSALTTLWPRAERLDARSWEPAERERHFGHGPAWRSFTHREQHRPASGGEKLRLAFAAVATACAALWLFSAEVGYLERQTEQLQHQVSLLKVKASRSEKVAARSGDTLREVRELRAMTSERQGILSVLKTLTDAMPPRVQARARQRRTRWRRRLRRAGRHRAGRRQPAREPDAGALLRRTAPDLHPEGSVAWRRRGSDPVSSRGAAANAAAERAAGRSRRRELVTMAPRARFR